MKYIDPASVECPNCGETREYPIEALRNFRATCLVCNYSFESIGKDMREQEAYWAYIFIDLVSYIINLEDKLNVQFEDKEVESLETFDELFRLTLKKLPPNYGNDRLKGILFEMASSVGNYEIDQLSLDMDLRDILERKC